MKKMIAVFFILSVSINSFGQAWISQYTRSSPINAIYFVNSNTGWIGGNGGLISKTTNGGITWTDQTFPGHTTEKISALSFLNDNTGWGTSDCCGGINSYAYLFKTTNGGLNWIQIGTGAMGVLTHSIAALNKDTLFLAMGIANDGNNYGAIKRTTNGGLNFTIFTSGTNNIIFSKCQFTDNLTGWSKSANKLFKSTDTGVNWINQTINGASITSITDFFFVDANIGFFSGNIGTTDKFFKTTNGGINWTSVNPALGLGKIFFINSNTGWVSNYNLSYAKTTNGGVNWTLFSIAGSQPYAEKIQFVNSTTGWILTANTSSNYVLYKTTNGGLTFVNPSSIETPVQFSLKQNYPNPFNPNTVISYQLPAVSYTSLIVYDVLGNEIETLVNEKQNAGSYSVDFNAASLPSGIYFYKLVTEKFSETKRMVLVK